MQFSFSNLHGELPHRLELSLSMFAFAHAHPLHHSVVNFKLFSSILPQTSSSGFGRHQSCRLSLLTDNARIVHYVYT